MAKVVRANSEIAKLFLSLTGSRNLWQVWSDVIFLIAVSISNALDTGPRKEEREKRYMEIIKNYSESERQVIVQISAAITEALDNKPDQDLLGGLFMELNLGNERGGQFFTPYMDELRKTIHRQEAEIDRLKKEKEKKMKPKDAHQDGAYWCPNCVRVIKPRIENCKIKIKYCPFCGQALDWSDTE